MVDIKKAKELLVNDTTCVFVKGETVVTSKLKGIAPLFSIDEQIDDTNSFSVADKIVGKAAAMLFVKMGIKEVYGEVMSVKGKSTLEKYHIPYSYKYLVEDIINRKGDDICPMEKTVRDVEDISLAYKLLKEKTNQ